MQPINRHAQLFIVMCVFFFLGLAGGCSPAEIPTTEIIQPTSPPSLAPLFFDFNNLPEGVPAEWQILFAPFDPGSQQPEVIKAQAQQDWFMIENQGTFSGLYAIHTGTLPSSNLEISMDVNPDGVNPMGVFIVCRYSEAGWYQFRVSNGGSAIQLVEPKDGIYNVIHLVEGAGVFLDDGPHKLGAVCDDKQLSLLADGREVLSKEADFLNGGSFGFGVESFSNPGGRKAFDNVSVQFLAADLAAVPSNTPAEGVAALPATATSAPISTTTSTPVPAPAATLRPTLIPEDQLVLYHTEFDDGDPTLADWKTLSYSMDKKEFVTDGYEAFVEKGAYHFRQGANNRTFVIYDKDLGTADVDLSTRGRSPFEGNGGPGLVCRYSEAGWYQFMVEPYGGMWSIRLVKPDENGQFHFHIISSASVPKWLKGNVDLRAECKGDRLTFYIDGEKVASVHDSTFATGKVGFLGWSFAIPDDWNTLENFTVRRAQWNDAGLSGSAPTPDAEGTIYHIDFSKLTDLSKHWARTDIGVQNIPGSPVLIGGPGGQEPAHTYLYINDFDPGIDVEIAADVHGAINWPRGSICRYSEDGWYEAFYVKDDQHHARVALVLGQRDEQGHLTRYPLDTFYPPKADNRANLTLTCIGNQISVKLNGEQVLFTEDNTWSSGRYGLLYTDNPPGSLTGALFSYSVHPVQTPKVGDVVYDATFNTVEQIASALQINLSGTDNRIHISEDSIQLAPNKDGLHLFMLKKYENGEFHLAAEIQAESRFILHCRSGSPADIGATLRGNGEWNIWGMEQTLANGNSPSIQPGKNLFALSCINDQVNLSANGETLATVTIPGYQPASGVNGLEVFDFSAPILVSQLRLIALQNDTLLASRSPLNQVSLPPTYQPGETIFTWDMQNFLSGCGSGWWGRDASPCLWTKTYNQFVIGSHHTDNAILVTPDAKKLTTFVFHPDLYDLPIEISANVTLANKNGGVALFCRNTLGGRYEFVLQADGKWFIDRAKGEWYERQAKNLTILAQGMVDNFTPENAQMSATCNGSDLIFTLNDVELGRVQDTLYPEGQSGVFFETSSEGSFTNLFIRRSE